MIRLASIAALAAAVLSSACSSGAKGPSAPAPSLPGTGGETAAPAGAIVVQVIPLLVETGQLGSFDRVVVVDVDPEVQIERLARRNGLSRAEALARIGAQATRADRLAAADEVLDNSGTPEQLRSAVDDLWARLRNAHRDRVIAGP